MKMRHEIYGLLAAAAMAYFMLHSHAVAADRVVVVPFPGGAVGNARAADVLKDKIFSSRAAGRGVSGTLELPQQYRIGDTGPGGGIVFWVSSDGQHGLEAAPADQGIGIWFYIRWYNEINTITDAVRGGDNAGLFNTERIIINQGAGDYAAHRAANYQGGGHGDWYLPSKEELNLLYLQKDVVGGYGLYWSSTESSSDNAWGQNFSFGNPLDISKYSSLNVRAVRNF